MKNITFKIAGVVIILILVMQCLLPMSNAESTSNLKNQKAQSDQDINAKKQELNEIKTEKSETQKQVDNLSNQIAQYQSQIDELDDKIDTLNSKIAVAEEDIKKQEEEYDKEQELLAERLVANYELGETSYLDVILSSKSITDVISNYYLITEVAKSDTELLNDIQTKKEEIEDTKQGMETDKSELDTSKANKEKVSVQLQQSKNEKKSEVAKLSAEEQTTQKELEQMQEDNDKLTKELKAAEARYQKQLEELKKKQQSGGNSGSGGSSGGGGKAPSGSGVLQAPVSGPITTTMYYSSGKYHGALDYGVPVGTTVYAAAEGVVVYSGFYGSSSYGYLVVIQHTNGLRTYYAHGNGTMYVSSGSVVSRGQAIMLSGNTGNSSGPHLHFEVRISPYTWSSGGGDCRVDPRNYM